MFPFIDELNALAAQGYASIARGELNKAKRIARKLDRSPYAEGWVHAEKILARLDIADGRLSSAKTRALDALSNAWGDPELLKILRLDNPEPDSASQLYEVCIRAGLPSRGPISCFSSQYTVTFDIIAADGVQALRYVSYVGQLEDGAEPLVAGMTAHALPAEPIDRLGVYGISPFGLESDPLAARAPLLLMAQRTTARS